MLYESIKPSIMQIGYSGKVDQGVQAGPEPKEKDLPITYIPRNKNMYEIRQQFIEDRKRSKLMIRQGGKLQTLLNQHREKANKTSIVKCEMTVKDQRRTYKSSVILPSLDNIELIKSHTAEKESIWGPS